MRFKPTSYLNPYFGHGRCLPRRPYDIFESFFCETEEGGQIENSDELRRLPESETQDEKMSEATTSMPPLSSVHEQSPRMAALALEKKMLNKMKKKPAANAHPSLWRAKLAPKTSVYPYYHQTPTTIAF
ncbi:hypothetical protein Bca4012_068420 [Brassica carinata]